MFCDAGTDASSPEGAPFARRASWASGAGKRPVPWRQSPRPAQPSLRKGGQTRPSAHELQVGVQ